MNFILWKPRLHYHDRQREKWLNRALSLQKTERGSCREKRAWKKFRRHDKWMYNFYHYQWLRHMKIELKDWHPYGAFANLPQLFMDMVDRCFEYWYFGYNVHVVKEESDIILAEVTHAKELADECRCGEDAEFGDYPADKLLELFTYVAQHVNNWSD